METNVTLSKSQQKRIIINQAVEEYIATPKLDKSVAKISAKYGINRKTLVKYLKERGVTIERNGSSSNFNWDFFHSIDSEEKAYWLGFLFADGYVSSRTNSVGLSISLKDIDHLKKYNQALNFSKGLNVTETHQFGTKDIHTNKNGETMYMVSTVISNKDLKQDLINCGCVPNKSLILEFPDESIFIESEKYTKKQLILHFIRGYFDGDGTLGLYQHSKTNPNKEESLIFVGTKSFLQKVQEYLGNGFLMQKSNCNENTYRLSYSTKKAYTAAKLMYDNSSVYLERKYNIYLDFASKNRAKTVNPEMGIPC